MAFSTPSYDLIDLFNRVDRGDLQLPDFQRDYSWDIDRIRALLITVLRGYPMGCFMALDVRNTEMRFRPRPVQGAPDTGEAPGLLLLDGQQRLTTLYHSLRGDGVVNTTDFRQKKLRRKFFVNVDAAVSRTIMPDEAVFSVNVDGAVMSHFAPDIPGGVSSRQSYIDNGVVPLSALLSDEGTDLLYDIADRGDEARKERIKAFHNQVLKPLVRYSVPMIRLDRETSRGGIGSIFAHANSVGMQMDVFDLLAAVFANDDPDFKLAGHWRGIEEHIHRYPVLAGLGRMDFLTAVTMYTTSKTRGWASGASEDLLRLDLATYLKSADTMVEGFAAAAAFLEQRCIYTADMVPYTSQIVPLAVILALAADDNIDIRDNPGPRDRLNRWFWSGIFGELYGSAAVISRSGRDVNEVTRWLKEVDSPAGASASRTTRKGKKNAAAGSSTTAGATVRDSKLEPASVQSARFNESRLLSVREDSAVYKGIFALIMGRGARDWRCGDIVDAHTFASLGITFHQIFPSAYCFTHQINPVLANSVLNRTPMSYKTDHMIGETAPYRYLPRVQGKSLLGDSEFDAVLASHLLSPKLLHASDAEGFFLDRRRQLLTMVEEAMGAPAVHDVDDSDLTAGEEGPNAFKP